MDRRPLIIVTVVILAAIAAGAWFYASRKPRPAPAPPIISPSPTPSKSPRAFLRGGEQTTGLKAVNDYGGEGEATRLIEPRHFNAQVTAVLPDPAPGKFYEAWLVRRQPFAQFPIGKLVRKDDEFIVELDQARDASTYVDIFVSLESKDDKVPEIHVLEGSFRP